MYRALQGVAAVIVGLTLVGCSAVLPASDTGKTPETAPVVTDEPAADESPDEAEPAEEAKSEFGEKVISPRGNIIKEIGQLAGTSLSDDPDVIGARFVVTDIVLDPKCDSEWADPPANGHYLAIHLNVETTPELAQSEFPEVYFTEYDWQAYDPDGKRLNDPVGNAWSCMSEASTLPMSIGPGQSVSGYIVLDVVDPSGTIVLAMGGSPTGWEWDY